MEIKKLWVDTRNILEVEPKDLWKKLNIKGEGKGELKTDSQDYGESNYIDTDIEYTEVKMVRGRYQEFFVLTY